jgi:hypothetical protein
MDNRKLIFTLIAAVVALIASPAWASYAIYVGKNLTSDGSVFIGGTGDEPSSHWLEIVPRKNHTASETISVGVTKEANLSRRIDRNPPGTCHRQIHHYELQ